MSTGENFRVNQPESRMGKLVGYNHPLTLCAYAKKCGFCNQHFHQLTPHLEVCFHRTFGDALHFGLVRRKAWFRELRELPQLSSL